MLAAGGGTMNDMPDILEGSCLCGRVRYRARAPWGEMDHCHCLHCRKSHGAAFATYIEARSEAFEWIAGRENLETYMADTGTKRSFCVTCGSTLTCWTDADPAVLEIAAGTLDTPVTMRARAHIFVRSKAPWLDILDDVPQYRTYRDTPAK